jgi:branched-chain amino acid transport system ATP-binding protein
MAALLEFRNIEAWHGPIPAPRGIGFAIAPGRIVAVLGANGASKSRPLRTICRLIDPRVGEIRCAAEVMHGRDPGKVVAST